MLLPSTKNFVYFLSENDHPKGSESQISNEKLTQILKTIAKYALKEKTTSMQDLEQVFGVVRGALTASLDRSFVCGLANQIEREVADDSHVLGAVTRSQP